MKKNIATFVLLVISTVVFAQMQTKPQWTNILSDKPETFRTQLVSSSDESIKVNVQVPGFYTTDVTTPRGEAKIVSVPKAVSTAQAGEPDVPMTGIPAIIGDRARMDIRIVDAQYRDFEGIEIAPSKGDFPRTIDPSTVPYTYGECYNQDAFFPANNVDLYEPYIVRDFRGQNMVVYPFAYNPVTKTLRVYYDMTIELNKVDDNGTNAMETRKSNTVKMDPDFKSLYQRHFINYAASMAKYTPLDEEGDLLIICYDNFISAMTDFVNWKKTRGINTTIVGTSTAGSTYSDIKTYIQNQYNANNNLTHVLLVGDVAQIPGYSYSGGGSDYSGLGDNAYGQVIGSDIYNDVIIGRFSASSVAQVTTQVNRTITYERDLTTSASWLQEAEGISRKENGSGHNNEDDYQHMDNIRTDLLDYGYTTVNQRYANLTGYDGSSSTISADINSGVGIVNYANHGQETAWGGNSSGYIYYANSHVNALTNENKLPFIFSVACLVGKYDHTSDCFAEAWMRATNNNNPTGAIGTLMSYISQPWIPPMWAQDECIDILVGNSSTSTSQKYTFGGVCINGLMGIFDHYSTSTAQAVGTYQAWIVYGDPTLMVRTKTPQAMTVNHDGTINTSATSYSVSVNNGNGALATITDANHNIIGRATVSNGTANISINGTLALNDELTLCVFGYNKVTYLGTITVSEGGGGGGSGSNTDYYTVTATANPTEGGTVTVGSSKGDRDNLYYDFEDGWQGWTTFQGNTTSPHSWMHNTEYVGYTTQGQIDLSTSGNNSSSGFMLSESYISAATSSASAYGAVTPDNYLVSPQIRLGGSITFYAASRMSNYPAEKFSVLVSESGNTNASDFTHTELTVTLSDNSWQEYNIDLSAYSGMGYVAIRHYDCNDQHLLYIDDVTIVEGEAPSPGSGSFAQGESCTVTATPNAGYHFVNWTDNGIAVSSNASYTFTVEDDRDLVANFSQESFVAPTYPWTPTSGYPGEGMLIVAQIKINGASVDNANWEVGAFCNDECRGISDGLDDWTSDGLGYFAFMNVVGYDDDVIEFYLYDKTNAKVYEAVCTTTVNLVNGGELGIDIPGGDIFNLNFVTKHTYTKSISAYDTEAKNHYYLIASPIGEVSPANVTNMLTNNYDLYYFDQKQELEWINYEDVSNNFTNLVPGKGYLYANSADVTLEFVGFPYSNNGEVTLTKEEGNTWAGWNLVGNPFTEPAYINKSFFTMNTDGTDLVPATAATAIQPMEGIFVIADTDGEILTFSTESSSKSAVLVMSVTQNRGITIDRAIVRFDEGASLPKFMLDESNTKLYIPQGNKDYAVVTADQENELPLHFKAAKNGTYTISISAKEVSFGYLHLIDNKTGMDIDLLTNSSYTFDALTSDYASRFRLVFNAQEDSSDSFAFISNGQIVLTGVDGDATLQVIDVLGHIILSRNGNIQYIPTNGMAPGVYVLRLIEGNETKTQKLVIK